MLDENKDDKLYDLYKTFSSNANIEIYEKIKQFNSVSDFFDYYTKIDSKFLLSSLNELQYNFSKIINNETSSIYFQTNTDQYISFLSKVTFLLKSILINKKIIANLLSITKNYYEKFSNENKFQNCHNEEISNLINSLLEQSQITNISSNIIDDNQNLNNPTENENMSEYSLFNQNFIKDTKNKKIENEKDSRKNKKYLSSTNNNISKDLIEASGEFTFSKRNYENQKTARNDGSQKKNKQRGHSSFVYTHRKSDKYNDIKSRKPHKHYSDSGKIAENKELFENLLEFTNKLYHHNFINREEKLKLKKLIISRDKKMEEFYINFEKDENSSRNQYIQEIKKLIG